MRSEFSPPPEIVPIKILTFRHDVTLDQLCPKEDEKFVDQSGVRRNEELFSSSSLARTNDTDFAGSRMLLKSEDSSNELLFLDARLSNAAINIIGQI